MMDGYCTWCGSAGSCDCYSDNPPQRPAYTNLLSDSETQSHLTQPGPDDGLVGTRKLAAEIMVAVRQARFPKEYAAEAHDEFESLVLAPLLLRDKAALSERNAELERMVGDAERRLEYALAAIETGRSEPLFIARDDIRNYFEDCAALKDINHAG